MVRRSKNLRQRSKKILGFGDSLLSLLGLDLVERLEADLSLYLTNKLDQDGKSELQDELEEISETIEEKKDELDEVEGELQGLNEEEAEIEQEVSRLEEELAQEGGTFAQQRDELKSRRARLESEKESIEEQIREEVMGDFAFSLVPDLCQNVRERLQEETERQHSAAAREQVVNELETSLPKVSISLREPTYLKTRRRNSSPDYNLNSWIKPSRILRISISHPPSLSDNGSVCTPQSIGR